MQVPENVALLSKMPIQQWANGASIIVTLLPAAGTICWCYLQVLLLVLQQVKPIYNQQEDRRVGKRCTTSNPSQNNQVACSVAMLVQV